MEADEVRTDPDEDDVEESSSSTTYQGKLAFMKYNEIINHESALNLKKIVDEGYFDPKIEYVMSEKVHGANFSMSTDGKEVIASKRTSILTDDTKFYNFQKVLSDHKKQVIALYKALVENFGELDQFTIFGELFGGLYPAKDVPRDPAFPMHVQKGVYYCPAVKFYAFDIKLSRHGYLDFDTFETLCKRFEFLYAECLKRGSISELMKFDVEEFVSTLPKKFGLPPIDEKYGKNIAEGVVIKPVRPLFLSSGSRVIVKIKSFAFKEVAGFAKIRPKLPPPEVKALDPIIANEIELLLRYVTENRLRNVI